MTPPVTAAVLAGALVAAALAVLTAVRDRPPGRPLLRALLGVQLLLLVQLAVVLYRVSGDDRPAETGAFTGYAVLSLLLLPGGFALTVDERTRWGSLALAVAALVVAVVELRMVATWS